MAIIKKNKVRIRRSTISAILIISSIFLLFLAKYQTVEIIYFINPRCVITNITNDILDELKVDFQDRIKVREIKVSMYPDDQPDTEEIRQLREQYQVYGVPEIIINGKEFTKKFTKDNLKEEICKNFIIRPRTCQ